METNQLKWGDTVNNDQTLAELNSLITSIQQNRQELQRYLAELQQQYKTILQDIQQIQQQQAVLQNSLNNDLSQFEQKASTGQGLQGLFNGNQQLKNEIMQKRVSLEKNVGQLRNSTQQLMDKLTQMGNVVQQMNSTIPNQLQQGQDSLLALQQSINSLLGLWQTPAQAGTAVPAEKTSPQHQLLTAIGETLNTIENAYRQLQQRQVLQQLGMQVDQQLYTWNFGNYMQ